MNEKTQGVIREALAMTGAALMTYGVGNAELWQQLTGGGMAATALIFGIRSHAGVGVLWTTARKLLSAVAGVLVIQGMVTPEKAEAVLGAALAISSMAFSMASKGAWLPPEGSKAVVLLLTLGGLLGLPSCAGLNMGLEITPDGCGLATYHDAKSGMDYKAGACFDESGVVDRYVMQWENPDGVTVRAVRTNSTSATVFFYRDPTGQWIQWSSKSGITLGALPEPPQPGPAVLAEK